MQQVIALHGGTTFMTREECLKFLTSKTLRLEDFDRKTWRRGLGDAIGGEFQVHLPSMPNKEDARYSEWKVWFDKVLPLMDDGVMLVGHSLGGIFLAKYLAENKPAKKVKATFLVAAPLWSMADAEKALRDFLPPRDMGSLSEQAGKVFLYHSEDDAVVPYAALEEYREALPQATVRSFTDRGHFIQENFLELVTDIRSLS